MHPNCVKDIKKFCKHWDMEFDENLSAEFLRRFKGCFSRRYRISCTTCFFILSEEFIREFHRSINWYCASSSQKLSETIIRDFAHEVDWYNISLYQELSEKFILEFSNKIYWNNLLKNDKLELTEEFYEKYKDKLNAS